jgi:glutathione synthase/RimK-type ligase-like ATP-grasp enzyme
MVLIRSCWDYHLRPADFLAWLHGLRDRGVIVLNPPPVVEWNMDKRYLLRLAEAGVDVGIPTVILMRESGMNDVPRLGDAEIGLRHDWTAVVVKPTISASAHETWRTAWPPTAAALERLRSALGRGPVLIQPFLPEIANRGETSLVFVAGRFSHAVVKRPAAGDFRVQEEHGGSAHATTPPPHVVEYARGVLATAARLCGTDAAAIPYARVDVLAGERPRLMELELIEPTLYLAHSLDAPGRLADDIVGRM